MQEGFWEKHGLQCGYCTPGMIVTAAQLLNRTAWLYAAQGTPAMLSFLQGVGRVRSNDITLLDNDDRVLYSSPTSVYKAGRDAPDWFAGLVSPPPSQLSIAFPGGRLMVHSNASRAVLDAWDDFVLLMLSALGLLAVVNAGVFWLVGRSLNPLKQILAGLKKMEAGQFSARLPRFKLPEFGRVSNTFNSMADANAASGSLISSIRRSICSTVSRCGACSGMSNDWRAWRRRRRISLVARSVRGCRRQRHHLRRRSGTRLPEEQRQRREVGVPAG